MVTVIRRGVFETNSSSTHSICIPKEGSYTLPKSIEFVTGEFGWEVTALRSIDEKASYIYTGLLTNRRFEQVASIKSALEKSGVTAIFSDYELYEDGDLVDGYVDHGNELTEFLDAAQDEEVLFRYLFSDFSFILTGNDNGGDNDPEPSTYETHSVYYKGN
ncbi:MAG: hypothetical protein ACRCZS_11475 [Chroococcidiopsis sp.]